MRIIAAMFDTRGHAEEAIERLVSARCPRDAITFMPENELGDIASSGSYDWRKDKFGLWRGLAAFEVMSDPDKYCFAEGMNRGASILLVAAPDETAAERFGLTLVEAGAVDLDEREKTWRDAGWTGFDGGPPLALAAARRRSPSSKLRVF